MNFELLDLQPNKDAAKYVWKKSKVGYGDQDTVIILSFKFTVQPL